MVWKHDTDAQHRRLHLRDQREALLRSVSTTFSVTVSFFGGNIPFLVDLVTPVVTFS